MRPVFLWAGALSLAVVACGRHDGGGAKAPLKRKAPAVTTVVEQRAPRELSFLGTVFTPRDALLSSARGGRIEEHLVQIGDRVTAGQVLVRLGQGELAFAAQVAQAGAIQAAARVGDASTPDKVPSVEAAKASLDAAEDAVQRAEKLHAQGSLSEQELLRVRTTAAAARAEHQIALASARADFGRLREARASVGQASAALGDKEVRAPFDGVVLQRLLEQGYVAAPNEAVLRVADVSELYVRFEIPQAQASDVALGSKVYVAAGQGRVSGEVVRLTPGLVGEANARQVQAKLIDPPGELLLGARTTVWLELSGEPETLVVVPLSSTLSYAGVYRAWVLQDGRLNERLLSVARVEGDHLYARAGLRQGDALITTPLTDFRMGEEVAP